MSRKGVEKVMRVKGPPGWCDETVLRIIEGLEIGEAGVRGVSVRVPLTSDAER